jgi:hypothetical protein
VCAYRQHCWQPFRTLVVTQRDRVTWRENARLTARWQKRTHLFAVQRWTDKDPWLLASSLPTARETRQVYARRMWLEELFGNFKKHGVDVETTQLRHVDRLSRLVLAVCL